MTIVNNEYGIEINFDSAIALMDDDIREQISGTVDTDQEFFDAYCKAHYESFGEEFECAKRNPCY